MNNLVLQNPQEEEFLITLIDAIPDLICFKDGTGRWIKANEYTLQLYGVDKDVYTNKTDSELAELCPLCLESFKTCIESDQQAWQTRKVVRQLEQITRGDQVILLDITKIPLFHADGRRKALLVVGRDITEQKRSETQLQYLAEHDPLTHLPNRMSFQQDIKTILVEYEEKKDPFALLFLDVDRFKNVNDTLGHTIGDIILQQVSHRLSACLPNFKVYRLGGDEFTILLPRATREMAAQVAKNIIEQFEQPFQVYENSFFLKASIGIGLYPFDGTTMDTLVAHADAAMYRAKGTKNGFEFYQKAMQQTLSRALILEKELRKAVETQAFQVYYQPQISLKTKRLVGLEALIRWNHPTLGWISPSEFIPLAEETGLIFPITEWILLEACYFLKRIQNKGFSIRISVNLSPSLFQREELTTLIVGTLRQTQIPPLFLELEVTESVMKDHKRALKALHKIKELGIRVAVDDFGTGYSSLNYLIQFPIDTLKIDQCFIKHIEKRECAAIVKTIIDMAHNLDLNVIAEGIESKEQEEFLLLHGCLEGQGYYFGHPLPCEAILQSLLQQADNSKITVSSELTVTK